MNRVLLLLIISSFFFSACQKDLSSINTNPSIIAGLDSTYLDTVYFADIRSGVTDTQKIFSYRYDAMKRLTLAKWVSSKSTTIFKDSGSISFSYISNDSLPYRAQAIRTYDLGRTFDTSTKFYFYDLTGRLIKDSTVGSSNNFNTTFTSSLSITGYVYLPGQVSCYSTNSVTSTNPTYNSNSTEKDTSFINTDGNILKTVFYNLNIGSGVFRKVMETNITYDNRPISYLNLNIFHSMSSVFNSYTELFPPFDGKRSTKNPLSVTNTYYDTFGNITGTIVWNHAYTYTPDGFPQSSSYDDPYGQSRRIQYQYKYKKM